MAYKKMRPWPGYRALLPEGWPSRSALGVDPANCVVGSELIEKSVIAVAAWPAPRRRALLCGCFCHGRFLGAVS
jgi:hypothetical protein